jgi:hypothetical protein
LVPHVVARQTHQRLSKFSFVTPKRLLQQYRSQADLATPHIHLSKRKSRGAEEVSATGRLCCKSRLQEVSKILRAAGAFFV